MFNFVPATIPPTADTDLYLKKSTVFASFADGLSADDKVVVAASQRPATIGALNEPSGTPAWRTIPSWNLVGIKDKIIPYRAQRTMAERAGSTIMEFNAGHVGLMSDPKTVTRAIERAARARLAASPQPAIELHCTIAVAVRARGGHYAVEGTTA